MLTLRGELVVVGKSPDGDSIRFIPRSPSLLRSLEGGERVDPSSDGSVQLRLDGIDAPETHYNGLAQPLAEPARAELLAWCGFTDVRWSGEQVGAATPERIAAAVQSALVDPNGRPIVLLLVGAGLPADGADVEPDVARTANLALAASGAGYGTFYATSEAPVRARSGRRERSARGGARRVGAGCERGLRAAHAGLDRPAGRADPAQALPPLLGLPARRRARDAAAVAARAARGAELARRRGVRRR